MGFSKACFTSLTRRLANNPPGSSLRSFRFDGPETRGDDAQTGICRRLIKTDHDWTRSDGILWGAHASSGTVRRLAEQSFPAGRPKSAHGDVCAAQNHPASGIRSTPNKPK